MDRTIYDEFYVAYFDASGNIVYPSDLDEVKTIKELLKHKTKDNFVFINDKKLCYKVRVKRKILNGFPVQVVELSNVTEFFRQVTQASVDEITHLDNRKLARISFMQYIEQAYERKEDFAIVLADLDDFKAINDTYGHPNGDIVLKEVSRILICSTRQVFFREKDIVARIGGDEFGIIMKNVSADISIKRAKKICTEVANHKVSLFSEEKPVNKINAGTLSIGVYPVSYEELAEFYKTGKTTDQIREILVRRCDLITYASKYHGKNQVSVYSEELAAEMEEIMRQKSGEKTLSKEMKGK